MVKYRVVFSKLARKDAKKLARSNLRKQTEALLEILEKDPFLTPPRYESLRGKLSGCFSRRINLQHRLVYEVFEKTKTVHVLRMWTHYDE